MSGVAQIAQGGGEIGFQFDGTAEGGDRFIETIQDRERFAEIVMGLGVPRIEIDRAVIGEDGLGGEIGGAECDAEIVPARGFLGWRAMAE